MADTPEDFPPCFALSSTMGRSRAYDLLLREAGKILNCPPSRVPLSPRRRTRRTKRHTPARLAKRSRPGNTSSQPSVPFPSTASSQGPFCVPASPFQPAGEAAAAILSPLAPAHTPSSPPSCTDQQETNVQPREEESSSSESEQEERHSSHFSSSSGEHSNPPPTAPYSPQATMDNNSQLPVESSAPVPSISPSHTIPKGKEARRTRHSCVLGSMPPPADGSVLSPFLFNVVLAPLIECLPSAAPFPVRAVIYADDVALYVRGPTQQASRAEWRRCRDKLRCCRCEDHIKADTPCWNQRTVIDRSCCNSSVLFRASFRGLALAAPIFYAPRKRTS
ncbi:hypothetical protein HPB50_025467 [Hyalomma asiaticum]|uniref:Uncharacterized protein n=1 Tax=Hyalomma asiaticum TaxID=266040 RepID=A0ACB7SCZ8_HYAAI|nr:hypothetical protein HPB50_025467 [Hyalomma asiaticum]